jgi:hypothetical protein
MTTTAKPKATKTEQTDRIIRRYLSTTSPNMIINALKELQPDYFDAPLMVHADVNVYPSRRGPVRTFTLFAAGMATALHIGQGLTLDDVIESEQPINKSTDGSRSPTASDITIYEGLELAAVIRSPDFGSGRYTILRFDEGRNGEVMAAE